MQLSKIVHLLGPDARVEGNKVFHGDIVVTLDEGGSAWVAHGDSHDRYRTSDELQDALFKMGKCTEATVDDMLKYAEWTLDCGNKQDFDFGVIDVSTRYWPDCTAQCTVGVRTARNSHIIPLETKWFEGKSEIDVKHQVEQWLRTALNSILTKLI